MAAYARVALFLDYENFFTGLRRRGREPHEPPGPMPRVDFEILVQFITRQFGPLATTDFIVVANFTHFDPQKGGLNRAATLVDVNSFKHRLDRQQDQASPGKRHVTPNYADMRLAFEVGQHAARQPAEVYVLASGDGAYAAVGEALRTQGVQVVFLLPDPERTSRLIKDGFLWFDVQRTGAVGAALEAAPGLETSAAERAGAADAFCATLSHLRQELSSPIPLALLRVIYGQTTETLLNQARGRGWVDTWDDPTGITCVSRREERVQGRIYPLPVRGEVAARTALLQAVPRLARRGLEPTRAAWRRGLKDEAGLSVRAAKEVLEVLLELRILREGTPAPARLEADTVLRFLHHPAVLGPHADDPADASPARA